MKQFLRLSALALATALLVGCGSAASQAPASSAASSTASSVAASSAASASSGVMGDFSATTLGGDTFTQAELQDYDLTMVNVWATWCGFCVEEMPELQSVYENLPENVNLITICTDGDTEAELANQILQQNGCTFPVLLPDAKLSSSLLNTMVGLPTTVFVDKDGNQVGDAQVGVPGLQNGDGPAAAYQSLIADRLMQLGG